GGSGAIVSGGSLSLPGTGVTLAGSIAGSTLSLVAGQDLVITGSFAIPATDNFNLLLTAGANLNPQPPAGAVTVTGGSSTGGSIQVTGPINTKRGKLVAATFCGEGGGGANNPRCLQNTGGKKSGPTPTNPTHTKRNH